MKDWEQYRDKALRSIQPKGEVKLVYYERGFNAATEYWQERVRVLVGALEFYSALAEPDNHEFIFDDETVSRGKIYERYQQYSIGDIGIKARKALEEWNKS